MQEEIFRKIGLTSGETNVYTALLYLGQSTIGAICRQSGVSRSKVYDILDRLIEKGLASVVVKNDTKHFSASDPRMILDYLEKKEQELQRTKRLAEKSMGELLARHADHQVRAGVEVYEGFNGLKAIRDDLVSGLKKGDELLVLGAPKVANEKWEGWFLKFHSRREKRGVGMRIIYNHDAREFGKKRRRFKNTKVKYLPGKLVSPNWFDIYNEVVVPSSVGN